MSGSSWFWNKMAGIYDKQVLKKFGKTYRDTIEISEMYLKPEHEALDVACGTGITTVELAKNVKSVFAVDVSYKMIEIAKKKAEKKKISSINFKVADVLDPEIKKRKFDVVFLFNIIYFIEDVDKVMKYLNERLKPEGIILSSTDCLGEKFSIITCIQKLLIKLKILPFMRFYKDEELEALFFRNNFKVVEKKVIHENPSNYFIVAVKH
jgi:2-polyprenyl-3-methyl-5-hydroxy-6-metoxy-1,4-benzoquinol methylase